jgi:hypothetical protein
LVNTNATILSNISSKEESEKVVLLSIIKEKEEKAIVSDKLDIKIEESKKFTDQMNLAIQEYASKKIANDAQEKIIREKEQSVQGILNDIEYREQVMNQREKLVRMKEMALANK